MRLKIASRKSDLARIQAYQVARALRTQYPDIEIEHEFRASLGDQNLNDPLWKMPEKGVFTDDFVEDLERGRCDLVVHSWKDLPLDERPRTQVVATLPRADLRDLLLVRRDTWEEIFKTHKLRVLSSSPRREYNLRSFLREALPVRLAEIDFVPVRGNIPTRLNKLFNGDAHALVLAKAALDRLLQAPEPEFKNLQMELRELLQNSYWMVLPLRENPAAAAQGALAIEIARDNEKLKNLLQSINHLPTFKDVQVERDLLRSYGGGCHQKIGISHITRDYGEITFLRGQPDRGDSFFYSKFTRAQPLDPQSVAGFWPMDLQAQPFFKRVHLKVQIPPRRPLWIARADALPQDYRPELTQIVWTAGLQTWKKLASRGVWVNGSAEGLGEAEDPQISILAGADVQWLKLTHADAPGDQHESLATYELHPTDAKPDFSHMSHFFWMSGSQFDRALSLDRRILQAMHACGPGNTFLHLQNRLGKNANRLQIYLSYEDWKKEMMRGLSRVF